eukprot:g1467.t1
MANNAFLSRFGSKVARTSTDGNVVRVSDGMQLNKSAMGQQGQGYVPYGANIVNYNESSSSSSSGYAGQRPGLGDLRNAMAQGQRQFRGQMQSSSPRSRAEVMGQRSPRSSAGGRRDFRSGHMNGRPVDGTQSAGVARRRERRANRNETLANASARDQLYFSKRARHVNYTPKTLQDYRRQTPKEYVELGKLPADLNSEELIAK